MDQQSQNDSFLRQIKEAHEARDYLEAVARGEAEVADDFTDDILLSAIKENLGRFKELSQSSMGYESFSDLERFYWSYHCMYFYGYILTRAHAAEAAEHYFKSSQEGFETFDQHMNEEIYNLIIDTTNGRFVNAVTAALSYAGALSQQEKQERAGEAYKSAIDLSRGYSPIFISEALRKSGEFFRIEDPEAALGYFKEAMDLLEADTDLDTTIQQGDLSLLYLKDSYATQLEIVGKTKESKKLRKKLKPYEELISWRFEENLLG